MTKIAVVFLVLLSCSRKDSGTSVSEQGSHSSKSITVEENLKIKGQIDSIPEYKITTEEFALLDSEDLLSDEEKKQLLEIK